MNCGTAVAWTKDERRSGDTDQAVVDLTMYTREYESSLSLDLSECVAQIIGDADALPDANGADAGAANTPPPTATSPDETAHTGGATDDADEEEGEVFLSPTAVESAGASTRVPTTSNHQHPLAVHRAGPIGGTLALLLGHKCFDPHREFPTGYDELELEDYLCTCLYCPRAVAIQRAYQLYGFALDHPQSEALLRVLRACANYDETVVEIDPLLVLHAEKLLEELQLRENEAFRLLVASHFQRRS